MGWILVILFGVIVAIKNSFGVLGAVGIIAGLVALHAVITIFASILMETLKNKNPVGVLVVAGVYTFYVIALFVYLVYYVIANFGLIVSIFGG